MSGAALERSLAIFEATQGPEHPCVVQPLRGLGKLLAEQGRHVEAKARRPENEAAALLD